MAMTFSLKNICDCYSSPTKSLSSSSFFTRESVIVAHVFRFPSTTKEEEEDGVDEA